MPFTHTLRTVYSTNAGNIIDTSETVAGAQQIGLDTTLTPEAQSEFDCNIVTAEVQSILIWCDQPATVLTNDPNSPQDNIPLKANVPVVWTLNSYQALPFRPGAVNKLFVTNNGAVTANFKLRMLSN